MYTTLWSRSLVQHNITDPRIFFVILDKASKLSDSFLQLYHLTETYSLTEIDGIN